MGWVAKELQQQLHAAREDSPDGRLSSPSEVNVGNRACLEGP
jgi:hypothetical protein